MATIPDGLYSISLPFGGGDITNAGEGRILSLLPRGSLGPDASKISVKYVTGKGYTFLFPNPGTYVSYDGEPRMNNKLMPTTTTRYFNIEKHEYDEGKFVILVADNKDFSVAPALERIYPPWVAMVAFPEKQPWVFDRLDSKVKL